LRPAIALHDQLAGLTVVVVVGVVVAVAAGEPGATASAAGTLKANAAVMQSVGWVATTVY
jgi:hypothetical protein